MKSGLSSEARRRLGRLPLLALGMASLLCGVWGGLIRLPMSLPLPGENANWISFHGPLMVCGFLGTLIGLERAVGLRAGWAYAAPLLTGAGAVMIIGGMLGRTPPLLITAGSTLFAAVTVRVVMMQPVLFTGVMSAGAGAWTIGNALWLAGWEFPRVVPWWIAFLALTIVGERLDLSRFQRPERWARPLLWAALGLFAGGVALSAFLRTAGERLTGAGLLALALWLGRFDIARRTVTQSGLTRFMAVCLLVGYGWLAGAGALLAWFSPQDAGLKYDAALHAFFVGFVFSMIFGHAPVIFPAVLQLPVTFHGRFYLHVVLLHAALLLRVGADLAGWHAGRRWGSLGSAVAIGVFLLNTVLALALARTAGPGRNQPSAST